ncbi:hypothetical protein [Microcoleus sp. CAWBG640]|uniref:hypothetical protein n=1 Tax=Microcoleus sp. CAWBG640 TaxID=2841653 RepID=UPI00312BC92F
MPESVGYTEVFRKKPGFWGLAYQQRNRVFIEFLGWDAVSSEKTRFLGPRAFLGGWAIGFFVEGRSGFWIEGRSHFWVDGRSNLKSEAVGNPGG